MIYSESDISVDKDLQIIDLKEKINRIKMRFVKTVDCGICMVSDDLSFIL